MKRARLIARLLVATVFLIPSLSGISIERFFQTRAEAQSHSVLPKIADELQELLDKSPEANVSVIIQGASYQMKGVSTAIQKSRGAVQKSFKNINALAVRMPAHAVAALANLPDVKFLSLDKPTEVLGHLERTTGADQARNYRTPTSGPIDGSGIGIAILDSGIDTTHHSFLTSRIVASVDFTGEGRIDDPYGHGTHVASIAAGNDHISRGAYTGIAPAAKLINVRVLNSQGMGSMSWAIAGIDWCITNKSAYNIKILNLSFGSVARNSYVNDPLCQAVRRAVAAGIVVCAAAGNSGKDINGNKIYGAIHSPGIEPSAITVGAANTYGSDSRAGDSVASYSSRGPTRGYFTDSRGMRRYDNLIKPDLIAPGNKVISARSPRNYLVRENPGLDANINGPTSHGDTHGMMRLSGSSMSTPVVAGAAALLLERNPALNPNLVKAVLEYTSQPLAGFSNFDQGSGLVNIEGAVRLAGLIRQDLSSLVLGAPLLVGAAPAQTSTIAGRSVTWGRGIIQKWNFISGSDLILRYQGIYGSGVLLSDGVVRTGGSLISDGVLLTDGTMLSSGVILSDGTVLTDGVILADGIIMADGVVMADGSVMADGVIMSDSTLASSMSASAAAFLAQSAMAGDNTTAMEVVPDDIL